MKKQRATFDVYVSPLQHAWLDVLGVDAPWLEKKKVAPKSAERLVANTPVSADRVAPKVIPAVTTRPTDLKAFEGNAVAVSVIAKQHNGLDDLNAQMLACKACNLCKNRIQAVVGVGVQRPAIMIVGEAPSEQEDRLNLPFAGRSGELLDKMLAAIGRQRDRDVYLTHVVKCRSPNSRNPRPEEIAACQPFLFAEIATLKPQLILAMGRSAAQALLGQDGPLETFRERLWSFNTTTHAATAVSEPVSDTVLVTQTGDSLQPGLASPAIPLLVTYHPAFLLSSPADKKRAWQDLQKARDLIVNV